MHSYYFSGFTGYTGPRGFKGEAGAPGLPGNGVSLSKSLNIQMVLTGYDVIDRRVKANWLLLFSVIGYWVMYVYG